MGLAVSAGISAFNLDEGLPLCIKSTMSYNIVVLGRAGEKEEGEMFNKDHR